MVELDALRIPKIRIEPLTFIHDFQTRLFVQYAEIVEKTEFGRTVVQKLIDDGQELLLTGSDPAVVRAMGSATWMLQGYYNYYGVSGNYASLQQFFGEAMQILRTWLNRRSQRKSYSWEGFRALIEHFQVPRPRICPRPRGRMAVSAS